MDLKSGKSKKIASENLYGPSKTVQPHWSPDSKWIAYTLSTASYIQKVYLYSLDQDKSFPVTDGMSDASEPVFDGGGKYLYFLASTDAGPVRNWFSLGNQDFRVTRSIYLIVLRKDLPSPLLKESDEEKVAESKLSDESDDEKDGGDKPKKKKAPPKPTVIDLENIQDRVVAMPIPAGDFSSLQVGAPGNIFYMKTADAKSSLEHFELKERKSKSQPTPSTFSITSRNPQIRTSRTHRQIPERRFGGSSRSTRSRRKKRSPQSNSRSLRRTRVKSKSKTWRFWSIPEPNGLRCSTKPGGSTATISTR
jgi:tricorn protease-like protein